MLYHAPDAPVVERHLTRVLLGNTSYFETVSPEPERFYHGLVVRSNRESGLGRCDVLVLKSVDVESGETVEKAMRAALRQIRSRDYAAELRARGAVPIHEMAAVFAGDGVDSVDHREQAFPANQDRAS